jgi:hypothetical protein
MELAVVPGACWGRLAAHVLANQRLGDPPDLLTEVELFRRVYLCADRLLEVVIADLAVFILVKLFKDAVKLRLS